MADAANSLMATVGETAITGAEPTDAIAKSLTSVAFRQGVEREFWRLIRREDDRLYFECFTWYGDSYVLELVCDHYRVEPCRGRFVNRETFKCEASAWPQGTQVFYGWIKWTANDLFICWPGDRGAVEHHAEWRALNYWQETDNPITQFLEFIRACLNMPSRGYLPPSQRNPA
jgi:hypothetical protein